MDTSASELYPYDTIAENVSRPVDNYTRLCERKRPFTRLVKSLEGADAYYITPYLREGVVVGAVIVEAETGEFHGAAVSDEGWKQYPGVSGQEAEFSVHSQTQKKVVSCELVWQFCEESKSRYDPFWKVSTEDGTVRYVTQDGKVHQALTRHSCVGR